MAMLERLFDIETIYEQIKKRPPSHALGLIYNPFPPTGIAGTGEEATPFYPRQGYITHLNNFIRSSLQGGDFCGLVVMGEYGSGKTSLLRHFARDIASAQAQGIPVSAVYAANPGTSFADILQSMTRSVGQTVLAKYAWAHIINWLKTSPTDGHFSEVGLPVPSKDQLADVSDAHDFWYLFRDELGISQEVIAGAVISAMQQTLPDLDFAEGLSAIMLGDRKLVSQTWSKLTKQLPPYSAKKPVAAERMASLMVIFKSNGVEHLFLLLDEVEDVVFYRMTKRLRDDFTASLRAIIGEHGGNLSIVLASNLPGWQLLVRSDPSLEDRFRFRIELTELTPEEIHELIWRYIERAKDAESNVADRVFQRPVAGLISKFRRRMPRSILTAYYSLVEHFWDLDHEPSPEEMEQFLTSA